MATRVPSVFNYMKLKKVKVLTLLGKEVYIPFHAIFSIINRRHQLPDPGVRLNYAQYYSPYV
jgi:hypothetical protein